MIDCAEAEALLAIAASDETATLPAGLREHLDGCEACARLARDLEADVVAGAIAEARDERADLAELMVVPRDLYARGGEIGRGGMGRIVHARDRRLGRDVAIKELLDERMRARFEREARLTARLQHPAIVSVHEAGRWPDGEPFYVMKYVAGKPLDRVIAERREPAERLALVPNLLTVADAIAYAHSQRIIHRDLKPHNILIGAFGETVVVDWGLAKDLAGDGDDPTTPYRLDPMTSAGAGTPAYMPPEQARGDRPDERVDVFALGATLYHVIAGRMPDARRSLEGAPPELATIVAKAMAPAPADRYPSARELAEDLRRFQNGQLVGAHRYTAGMLVRRWLWRHRAVAGLVALFAVILAAGGALSIRRIVAERDGAERAYGQVLAERGRQESIAGSPARALVYLQAALARGVDTQALRFLLGQAGRATAALRYSRAGGFDRVVLSPDGSLLAASNDHGDVELRDLATGASRAFPSAGNVIAIDPTNRRLLLWHGMSARILDVATGASIAELADGGLTNARWSRDGALVLLFAGRHAQVYAADGATVATLDGSLDELRDAVFDPTAARVATAGYDNTVHVWDVRTERELLTMRGHDASLAAVAFDPAGLRVAAGDADGRVFVWDAGGQTLQLFDLGESVRRVAFSADGATLLASSRTELRLWDAGRSAAPRLARHGEEIVAAGFAGDGTHVFVAGGDGTTRVFDTDGRLEDTFEGHGVRLVSASAGGAQVATLSTDGVVQVWQRGGRAPVFLPPAVAHAELDASGRVLTVGAREAQLWSAETGRLLHTLPIEEGTLATLVPGGVRLVAGDASRQWLWVPGTAPVALRVRPLDFAVTRVQSFGSRVALLGAENVRSAIDADSGAELFPRFALSDVVLSSDGQTIAARGRREITVMRRGVVQKIASDAYVRGVAMSRDRLLIYGDDLTARLYDLPGGHLLQVFRNDAANFTDAALSDDDALLLTGDDGGVARLWDVATGLPLAAWSLPGVNVRLAALSPRGDRALVATGSATWLLDLGRDARRATEIAAAAPFRLSGGALLPGDPPAVARPVAAPAAPAADVTCAPGTRRAGGAWPADRVAWCARPGGGAEGAMVVRAPGGGRIAERRFDGGRLVDEKRWDERGLLLDTIEGDGVSRVVTTYHPNGAPATRTRYRGDARRGEHLEWWPGGALRVVGSYGDCSLSDDDCAMRTPGLWMTFHRDGSPESVGAFLRRDPTREVRAGRWRFWDARGVAHDEVFPCLDSYRLKHTFPAPACK